MRGVSRGLGEGGVVVMYVYPAYLSGRSRYSLELLTTAPSPQQSPPQFLIYPNDQKTAPYHLASN